MINMYRRQNNKPPPKLLLFKLNWVASIFSFYMLYVVHVKLQARAQRVATTELIQSYTSLAKKHTQINNTQNYWSLVSL